MATYYERLKEFKDNYPELTFDNKGYERFSDEIREKYKDEIDEISYILKETVAGFSSFTNFKPYKEDGSFDIRLQYDYNHNGRGICFIGVGYFNINNWKNYEIMNTLEEVLKFVRLDKTYMTPDLYY